MSYGTVFTTEDMKRQLYNLNRNYNNKKTWSNLFADAGINAQQQINQSNYDYANAMSQAYLSSLNSNSLVAGSNVIGGNKQALIDQNSLALRDAFDTYAKQHASNVSQISANLSQQNAAIDEALTTQAKNTVDYANAHYDYLTRLYEMYENGENELFNNANWQKYLHAERDEDGKIVTDGNGNIVYDRLLTWNELATAAKDEKGEWLSLYDEDDNLTIRGADFFDQMENELADTGKGLSFGEYLSEANPDLLDWSMTYNPYDVTEARTNAGSFKTMFGMTSKDEEYTWAERLGGFTSGELENTFSKFTDYAKEYSEIVDKTGGGARNKRKAAITKDMANEVLRLTDELGITNDIEETIGVSIKDLALQIEESYEGMFSGWDLAGNFFENLGRGLLGTDPKLYTDGTGLPYSDKTTDPILALSPHSGPYLNNNDKNIFKSFTGQTRNEYNEKNIESAYLNMVNALVTFSKYKQSQRK